MEKIEGKVKNAEFGRQGQQAIINMMIKGEVHKEGRVFGSDSTVIALSVRDKGTNDMLSHYGIKKEQSSGKLEKMVGKKVVMVFSD